MKIALDKFASVTVTPNTTWTFAALSDGEGNSTVVEITLGGESRRVADAMSGLAALLLDEDVSDESRIESLLGMSRSELRTDRIAATAVSGLRTAVAQLRAARAGESLSAFLGGRADGVVDVELYANINRCLLATDRAPADFARAAERAARAGFRTFKCAPFDEARPPSSPSRVLDDAAPGLARVRAVRDAVGPDARVLVDCHSRFERDTAPLIVEELAKLNVGWFEEPVQPTSDAAALAEIAFWTPMPVAGGESGYGADLFDELLDSEAVSIIMPDIKHCGGAAEAARAGRSAVAKGKGFSMHSPSGPVSLIASGHATAAVRGAMPLEHAVYEAEWRAEIVAPAERVENGRLRLPPGAGLGAELNWDIVRRFGAAWTP